MSKLMLRVNHQELSLWQSVVAEYVKNNHFPEADLTDSQLPVLQHDMVKATNVFVNNRFNKLPEKLRDTALAANAATPDVHAHVSELGFEMGKAQAENRMADAEALAVEFRKFSDADKLGFASCAATYAAYYTMYAGSFKYNDWKVAGIGDINYGVINYKLPNNAKVGIIGDWGTGLPDAYALLYDMVVNKKVDAIIHLGDIYYSGTPTECNTSYAALFTRVFKQTGRQLPVFTIPGNHDYYSLGWGYYNTITNMNNGIAGATQPASYFCLRTQDNGWQFLGMDTGYNESFPGNQFNPKYAGPWLTDNELLWHIHKLDTFNGATILLSHHQLYSANSAINGVWTDFANIAYLNPFLLNSFKSFFGSKVAGWLWGHEHNAVLYKENLYGLAKGRLIGASAYEELMTSDPYKVNYPQIPYLDPVKYRVGSAQGFYNHSYAVIDLSVRRQPTDPVQISYYEFPSWGATAPPNPQSTPILTESFVKPSAAKREPIYNNSPVYMRMGAGMQYIGPFYNGQEYYPQLTDKQGVALILDNTAVTGTPLSNNDIVWIETTEANAGQYKYLGAWTRPWIYYYSAPPGPAYNGQLWQIVRQTPSDDKQIYYGDAVCFINVHYSQWIALIDGTFLTTSDAAHAVYFTLEKSYM